jgi:DNA-binding Lrp family transcriptional regulator
VSRSKIQSSLPTDKAKDEKKGQDLKSSLYAPTTKSTATGAITITAIDATAASAASKAKSNSKNYNNLAKKQLDSIDIQIVSEILRDHDISSSHLSKKLSIPLSTIQRRRARIENSLLKKEYTFDFMAFGVRIGDLVIGVDKGRSKELARFLLQHYKANILSCTIRINSTHNVMAHIVYKDSRDLYNLIESVKSLEYVDNVQWSEVIEEIMGEENNNFEVVKALLNSHQ